mmetsp:Transcript_29873/g.26426  ORF Transcript_29873/g.26426 Transcript_29873/m.26426 type:complete len:230 (+) Transcript_29873:12-701(+)
MSYFDPWSFKTMYSKHWGWLYILIALVPFLIVLALTFYVLSLLMTDEDLYYKDKDFTNQYTYSTLSSEFSQIGMVAEIVPHFLLADEDDKYMPLKFTNNTYFKNLTYTDGVQKTARFEELYHSTIDKKNDLPHLIFQNEYVPFGDSKYLCLNLKFHSKKLTQTPYKDYTEIQSMPQCFGYKQEIWNPEDPTHGVNLLAWKEFGNEHTGKCENGLVKNNICFEYALMTEI